MAQQQYATQKCWSISVPNSYSIVNGSSGNKIDQH